MHLCLLIVGDCHCSQFRFIVFHWITIHLPTNERLMFFLHQTTFHILYASSLILMTLLFSASTIRGLYTDQSIDRDSLQHCFCSRLRSIHGIFLYFQFHRHYRTIQRCHSIEFQRSRTVASARKSFNFNYLIQLNQRFLFAKNNNNKT